MAGHSLTSYEASAINSILDEEERRLTGSSSINPRLSALDEQCRRIWPSWESSSSTRAASTHQQQKRSPMPDIDLPSPTVAPRPPERHDFDTPQDFTNRFREREFEQISPPRAEAQAADVRYNVESLKGEVDSLMARIKATTRSPTSTYSPDASQRAINPSTRSPYSTEAVRRSPTAAYSTDMPARSPYAAESVRRSPVSPYAGLEPGARAGYAADPLPRTGLGADTLPKPGFGSEAFARTDVLPKPDLGVDTLQKQGFGGDSLTRTGFGTDTLQKQGFGGDSLTRTGFGTDGLQTMGLGAESLQKASFTTEPPPRASYADPIRRSPVEDLPRRANFQSPHLEDPPIPRSNFDFSPSSERVASRLSPAKSPAPGQQRDQEPEPEPQAQTKSAAFSMPETLRLQQENVRLKAELLKAQKMLAAEKEENQKLLMSLDKSEQLRAVYKKCLEEYQRGGKPAGENSK